MKITTFLRPARSEDPYERSRITGLPIGRNQAEEEARKALYQPTSTKFDVDGFTGTRPKPVVIEEEEKREPTTVA
eukprot:scaffold5441_cov63-Cylindrotheca_fusiformis.AAC.1